MSLQKSITLTKRIKEEAFAEGFDAVGIAKVPGSSRIKLRTDSLDRWLEAGHQAKMEWMKSPRRKNIENMLDGVKSVLAVGLNYYVNTEKASKEISIARYGWGKDYHKVIEKKIKKTCSFHRNRKT